jgi:hypothetical protein
MPPSADGLPARPIAGPGDRRMDAWHAPAGVEPARWGAAPVPILGWQCPAQARRARWGAHGHSDPSRSALLARVRVDGEGSRQRAQRPVACPGARLQGQKRSRPRSSRLLADGLPSWLPPSRRTLACQHWGHVSLSPPMPSRGRCVADGRGDTARRSAMASTDAACTARVSPTVPATRACGQFY